LANIANGLAKKFATPDPPWAREEGAGTAEGKWPGLPYLLVLHVLYAFERHQKSHYPLYFIGLSASAPNLAKVEVASSSLVSRSNDLGLTTV